MQIALAIQKHNPDPSLTIDSMALKGNEREFLSRQADYDRCLIMGHQMVEGLLGWTGRIPRHWLTGIHSAHAFDRDLQTTPERDVPPPARLIRMLAKFHGVNAVSLRLTRLFSNEGLNVTYTPNGVDTDLFKPMPWIRHQKYRVVAQKETDADAATAMTSILNYLADHPENSPLVVGCAYTPKHDARKGVSEFIRPVCKKIGAVLVEAKARSDQHVSPENMPGWMNTIDCYVCASSSEGFSISVLEAAACGRLVISTRVGGSTELIEDEVNGFLVDRTVDCIAHHLAWARDHRAEAAEMGRRMRENVVANWSWAVRAPAWIRFLTES